MNVKKQESSDIDDYVNNEQNLSDSENIIFETDDLYYKKKEALKSLLEYYKEMKSKIENDYDSTTFKINIQLYKIIDRGDTSLKKTKRKKPQKNLVEIKSKLLESFKEDNDCPNIYIEDFNELLDDNEYINIVKCIEGNIKNHNKIILENYFAIGKVFSIFKSRYNKKYIKVLKDYGISYSQTHITFILRLYNLIEEYPIMKKSTLSLHFINQNFKKIELILAEEFKEE